jgi:hypothetical protein
MANYKTFPEDIRRTKLLPNSKSTARLTTVTRLRENWSSLRGCKGVGR